MLCDEAFFAQTAVLGSHMYLPHLPEGIQAQNQVGRAPTQEENRLTPLRLQHLAQVQQRSHPDASADKQDAVPRFDVGRKTVSQRHDDIQRVAHLQLGQPACAFAHLLNQETHFILFIINIMDADRATQKELRNTIDAQLCKLPRRHLRHPCLRQSGTEQDTTRPYPLALRYPQVKDMLFHTNKIHYPWAKIQNKVIKSFLSLVFCSKFARKNKPNTMKSPKAWVPSLYFAMGLPFVILNMVTTLMYKGMGISDSQIAFWTSLIMLPWTLKPLWSPLLEMYKTKKFFVVSTQILSGLLFGMVALALHLPSFFAITIGLLAVIALSGATHDIAADGVYMQTLPSDEQARYIGWQGAFYNIAKIVGTGVLVSLAGVLIDRFGVAQAWTIVMLLVAALMAGAGVYHIFVLPATDKSQQARNQAQAPQDKGQSFWAVFREFFRKRHIAYYFAFIILYRFAEGFVMKIVPLFLKADRAEQGLGLSEQQIGLCYGTFGAAAFVLGSILAGYYIARRGLRKSLFRLALVFNLPFVAYTLLAREPLVNRQRHRAGILRLRIRLRRTYPLHDATSRPRRTPDGSLRLRLRHHEPGCHAPGHDERFRQRMAGLPHVLRLRAPLHDTCIDDYVVCALHV